MEQNFLRFWSDFGPIFTKSPQKIPKHFKKYSLAKFDDDEIYNLF